MTGSECGAFGCSFAALDCVYAVFAHAVHEGRNERGDEIAERGYMPLTIIKQQSSKFSDRSPLQLLQQISCTMVAHAA